MVVVVVEGSKIVEEEVSKIKGRRKEICGGGEEGHKFVKEEEEKQGNKIVEEEIAGREEKTRILLIEKN